MRAASLPAARRRLRPDRHTREHALFFALRHRRQRQERRSSTPSPASSATTPPPPRSRPSPRATVDRHPTELAMLRGARLVTAIETEEGRRWAEGRDQDADRRRPHLRPLHAAGLLRVHAAVQADHRRQPQARPAHVDEAIRRRFHLIPFTVTIPPAERDQDLAEKLKAEWPGILQWAIDGCLEWQRNGLKPPEAVQRRHRRLSRSRGRHPAWMAECCTRKPPPEPAAQTLYASWKAVGRANRPKGRRRLAESLFASAGGQGIRKKKGRAVAMFFGLRVVSQDLGL